jgi:3'-phosphoadenosine 5'-phosphosulfate (PAPS) 3'-phosphatase
MAVISVPGWRWEVVWDVTAPALIVQEAGGWWSDAGGLTQLDNGSLVTGNPQVHPQVLQLMRHNGAPTPQQGGARRCG